MQRISFSFLAALFLILSMGMIAVNFSSEKTPPKPKKKPPVGFQTPPGTVWLRDSLYIDEAEVTNLDWLEYAYWTGRRQPEKYLSVLPDTNCWWREGLSSGNDPMPLSSFYLRHPAYWNYPAVGITWEQANAYCQWRSDRVNEFIYVRDHHVDWKPDTTYPFEKIVEYRLPSKEEWMTACAGYGNNAAFSFNPYLIKDKSGKIVANTREYQLLNPSDTPLLPSRPSLKKDKPPVNQNGCALMSGNVSEIISDRSVVLGLNYNSLLDGQLYDIKTKTYSPPVSDSLDIPVYAFKEPATWIGFRCVCEVKKPSGKK